MNTHSPKLTIAFDVNGTLTVETIQRLTDALDRKKCILIVWSSLGKGYAQEFCQRYGIHADGYYLKGSVDVDIAVDDHPETVSRSGLILQVLP